MSKPEVWDRYAIGAEVRRRGMNYRGIAIDAGLPEGACRSGVLGTNRKGAEAIAAALGIPFRTLFPNSYSRGRHNEEKTSRNHGAGGSAKRRQSTDTVQGVA